MRFSMQLQPSKGFRLLSKDAVSPIPETKWSNLAAGIQLLIFVFWSQAVVRKELRGAT